MDGGETRRGFLHGAALVGASAFPLGILTAGAVPADGDGDGARVDDPAADSPTGDSTDDPSTDIPLTDLGPASLSSAIVTGVLTPDRAYVVSRGITPANLGVLDRSTNTVETTPLPRAQGAWGSAISGGEVYVATYVPAVLYRVGTDGSATELAAPPTADYFFDLAAAPDGLLVAGGYPGGRLYSLDPATGSLTDHGQMVEGEQYVRSVAADESTMYAGIGSHAHLVAVDRATGGKSEILPEELRDDSFVYDLALTPTHIVAGMMPSGRVAIISKADPGDHRILRPGGEHSGGVDALASSPDGTASTVYVATRPLGRIYALDLATGDATDLGVPVYGQETRNLYVEDNRLIGFPGAGGMWTLHLSTGEVERLDLQQAGLTPGPELPLALSATRRQVIVGGNFGVQIHDVAARTSTRVYVGGEPKASVVLGDTAYLAVYPAGALETLDLRTGRVEQRTRFGHGQIRPRDMVHHEGRFLVGTQPEYGQLGGALVVVDGTTFATDVHRDVVPRQSISSIAAAGSMAYLGSEIAGGIGSVPTEPEAVLAFFDLERRSVVDAVVPVAGATRLQDLVVVGDRILGITDAGVLFEVDRHDHSILRTRSISERGGQLERIGDRAILTDGDRVLLIDLETWDVTVLVSGLDSVVAGEAQGDAVGPAGPYYTIRDTHLVRLDLRS